MTPKTGQVLIDIEDNENSGYFPVQVFESQGEPRSAAVITVSGIPGNDEPHEVVGWCSNDGNTGGPCRATAVVVGDSGSGRVWMIHGGDHGVRLRPISSDLPWDLESGEQKGEPYMLLPFSSELVFSD